MRYAQRGYESYDIPRPARVNVRGQSTRKGYWLFADNSQADFLCVESVNTRAVSGNFSLP